MAEIKTSIRFFEKVPVRSVWSSKNSKWFLCAVDIIEAITSSNNPKSYWASLKRRNVQLVAICKQLKLTAKDGKKYVTDVIDESSLNVLLALLPNKKTDVFSKWLTSMSTSIDERSKQKAYELFESGLINEIEVGTTKGLQQIHAFIFGGLFDFAGKIRTLNIEKDGFTFALASFLHQSLAQVEKMPEDSLENIVQKYVEMNVAHPFLEGNGRSTRIWLDLILKKNLKTWTDWSKIDKHVYLEAMRKSHVDSSHILKLIKGAQTSEIHNREIFIKGIDYSYYYEQVDE